MPDKKPSAIPKEELEAARKEVNERARWALENRKEEYLAMIATQQAKTVILLQEISSELSRANDTLAAILKATQKAR